MVTRLDFHTYRSNLLAWIFTLKLKVPYTIALASNINRATMHYQLGNNSNCTTSCSSRVPELLDSLELQRKSRAEEAHEDS